MLARATNVAWMALLVQGCNGGGPIGNTVYHDELQWYQEEFGLSGESLISAKCERDWGGSNKSSTVLRCSPNEDLNHEPQSIALWKDGNIVTPIIIRATINTLILDSSNRLIHEDGSVLAQLTRMGFDSREHFAQVARVVGSNSENSAPEALAARIWVASRADAYSLSATLALFGHPGTRYADVCFPHERFRTHMICGDAGSVANATCDGDLARVIDIRLLGYDGTDHLFTAHIDFLDQDIGGGLHYIEDLGELPYWAELREAVWIRVRLNAPISAKDLVRVLTAVPSEHRRAVTLW